MKFEIYDPIRLKNADIPDWCASIFYAPDGKIFFYSKATRTNEELKKYKKTQPEFVKNVLKLVEEEKSRYKYVIELFPNVEQWLNNQHKLVGNMKGYNGNQRIFSAGFQTSQTWQVPTMNINQARKFKSLNAALKQAEIVAKHNWCGYIATRVIEIKEEIVSEESASEMIYKPNE